MRKSNFVLILLCPRGKDMNKKILIISVSLLLLMGCSSAKKEDPVKTPDPETEETGTEGQENGKNNNTDQTTYGMEVTGEDLVELRRMAAQQIVSEIGQDAYKGFNDSSLSATTNGTDTVLAGEFSYMDGSLLSSQQFRFVYQKVSGVYTLTEKQYGDDVDMKPLDPPPAPPNIDDTPSTVNEKKIKEDGTRIWTFDLANGFFTANAHHYGEGTLRVWITDMDNRTVETLIDAGGDYSVSKTANVEPGIYKIWIRCTGGDWGISWNK